MTMGQGNVVRSWSGATLPAATGLVLLALGSPLAAQAPRETVTFTGETLSFENADYRFTVTFPRGCRYEEGPGTVDAICAPDFDEEKSATVEKAGALVLSFAYELVDTASAGNAPRFSATAFKDDLPESVCGESDKARARIENLKYREEAGFLVQQADVVCSEVKFLQIGERRATVAQTIAPRGVFRLTARAPTEDFQKEAAAVGVLFSSFFQSFTVLRPEKRQAEEAGKQ
jgi:hypothetical protein